MNDAVVLAKLSGRKGSRKVRTGCITCKIRKVKCDETKPSCVRCLRTGRKCDGYDAGSSRAQALMRQISPTVEIDSADGRRAFDFYQGRVVSVLGGAYNSEFWGDLVLKLSQSEPVVRHSLLSLSSFLDSELNKRGSEQELVHQRQFAFAEYGKAISSLTSWSSKDGSMAIPLLVCVLFTCIEFLLDRDKAAHLHICQGRKLLSSIETTDSATVEVIKREIVPIYTRLSLASFLFGSRPQAIPDQLRSASPSPTEFTSMNEARNHLYHLLDDALRFTDDSQAVIYGKEQDPVKLQALEALQQSILTQLTHWNSAFTVFMVSLPLSGSWRVAQSILQIYYNSAVVWVSTALNSLETGFDAHASTFASIISIASTVVNQSQASKRLPDFSFETELIAPLYWIVVKCRHPVLRRAALRLLLRDELRNRKENLWRAKESIIVSARAIAIEEGRSGFDTGPNNLFETLTLPIRPAVQPTCMSQLWLTSHKMQKFSVDPSSNVSPPLVITDDIHLPPSSTPWTDCANSTAYSYSLSEPENSADSEAGDVSIPYQSTNWDNIAEQSPLKRAAHIAATPPLNVNTSPPYNLPESRRLKNTQIGPRQQDGVWITNFKDTGDGSGQWNVTKEFLLW